MPLCKLCNNNVIKLNPYTQLCILCNIYKFYDRLDVYNIVLCISNMNQLDIIKATHQFLQKNNTIPLPINIDEHAIHININPTVLYECNIIINTSNEYENEKKILNNIKIFYTNTIDRNLLKSRRLIDGQFKQEKLNPLYFTCTTNTTNTQIYIDTINTIINKMI